MPRKRKETSEGEINKCRGHKGAGSGIKTGGKSMVRKKENIQIGGDGQHALQKREENPYRKYNRCLFRERGETTIPKTEGVEGW